MEHGTFAFVDAASYAPKLVLRIPKEDVQSKGCKMQVMVPLAPSVYYDPFTARVETQQGVAHVQHLGRLELEKQVGWSAHPMVWDAEMRAWWEGGDEDAVGVEPASQRTDGPCSGAACEHTAVLVDLDTAHGSEMGLEITIPLHKRYQIAQVHPVPVHVEIKHDAPAWLPAHIAPLYERAADVLASVASHALSWIARIHTRHYQSVELTGAHTAPILFAACTEGDIPEWDVADVHEILPDAYTHLRPRFEAKLQDAYLFVPPTPLLRMSKTVADMPVGDAGLYPLVQLGTFAATLLAMLLA
ncbi:hypothetical protein MVES_003710 [Malassezia vespertilionis]|uniref:Protein PBN1 n=2 Tax=Malassezia vespertilionis TaxID=2020962 RepID=A0A2N1J7B7_9BASI|nr:hypothetical protein MVES_003710 [Malassezia vespertilionis]